MIRDVLPGDVGAIAAIYGHEVLHGIATAEEVPPGEDEMANRIAAFTGQGMPWLVWQEGERVVGYAYARPYHARAAYRYTVEDGLYIDASHRGRGIGTALLPVLIERCAARGLKQMIGSITPQGGEASIALHARFGFVERGRLIGIIEKFGRVLDCVYMQRALG